MKIINEIKKSDVKKIDRIIKDCIGVHICPPPKSSIKIGLFDKDKKILEYNKLCQSWVRNAYNYNFFRFVDEYPSPSTFGAGGSAYKRNTAAILNGGAIDLIPDGDASYAYTGICAGTSNAAETLESYVLPGLISNGTGTGQLTYSAQTQNLVYDSGTKKWTMTISRTLSNNSGGAITVQEIGLSFRYVNIYYFLFVRDVLGTPVEIANGQQMTIEYILEYTFPG